MKHFVATLTHKYKDAHKCFLSQLLDFSSYKYIISQFFVFDVNDINEVKEYIRSQCISMPAYSDQEDLDKSQAILQCLNTNKSFNNVKITGNIHRHEEYTLSIVEMNQGITIFINH